MFRTAKLQKEMVALNEALLVSALHQHELAEAAELLADQLRKEIADRERAEAALREAQRMEAIGQLTGGLAHDLNNYLTVVIGNLDLLAELPQADEAAAGLIEGAMGGALRGAELTLSLLAFSRRQPLHAITLDLGERIAGVTEMLKRTIGENIVVELNVPEGLWPVLIDGAQLDTCILNLANNARDAMPAGGRVSISLSNVPAGTVSLSGHRPTVRDHVLIVFTDTGSGMDAETLARIFEPFFSTKGPTHGTGLGLSMVHGFVHQSGGTIRVESTPGKGTTVRICLLRAPGPGEAAADAPGKTPMAKARTAAPPRGHGRILLVEDNEAVRVATTEQLTSLGYTVVAVDSADDALALLEKDADAFDLVFSDVIMPGEIDGLDLARIVLDKWPSVRLLMTSGYSRHPGGSAAELKEKQSGLTVLRKPYRKAALASAVRAKLATRQEV